jgi:hypothetical protein
LKPLTDRFHFGPRTLDSCVLADLENLGCVVIEVFGTEGCFGLESFLNRHLLDCHKENCSMTPELFFPDPFVKGGWFVFQLPGRLFQWQAAYITYKGMNPAARHSTQLKALHWVEKEIQERLAPHEEDYLDGHFYSSQWNNNPGVDDKLLTDQEAANANTLIRLTYDWEPLNRALEAS